MDPETAWRLIVEKELAGVKNEVESIKLYLYSMGNVKEILRVKLKLFDGQDEMTRVYLRCDGERAVGDISEGTGIKQPNVTRAIKKLRKRFLVYETKNTRGKKVYARNAFDDEMGLVEELEKRYGR